MKPIKFNYEPEVAIKAVETISKECLPEQKKIFEDIETLAKLGYKQLEHGPANRETKNN